MKVNLRNQDKFENRHHGKDAQELQEMLETIGAASLDELIDQTLPSAIRSAKTVEFTKTESPSRSFCRGLRKIAS
jgi:glycine dehydrogenase